jgi:hypothetical protein
MKCADGSGTRYASPGMAPTWAEALTLTCDDGECALLDDVK